MSALIVYFDEVKYDPPSQPYYWLAGVAVDAVDIKAIESQVARLAYECFGTSDLAPESEFHASALINRRDHFKDWNDAGQRIATLHKLLTILDQHDRLAKIQIRLDPARMISSDIAEMAFLFFTEKVDALLQARSSVGLLIGDRENDSLASSSAITLSGYRARGTPYSFGRDIINLVDTVHFTHSHLSRMLQLADLYVWVLQFCAASFTPGSPQANMQLYIREETRLLSRHKYKDWPTDGTWIQV